MIYLPAAGFGDYGIRMSAPLCPATVMNVFLPISQQDCSWLKNAIMSRKAPLFAVYSEKAKEVDACVRYVRQMGVHSITFFLFLVHARLPVIREKVVDWEHFHAFTT